MGIIVEAADNEEKKESTTNEVIDSKEATTIGEKVEVVQKEITIVDNKKSRENKVDQDDSSSPNSQSPNFSSEKDSKETTGEDQDMASKVTKEEKENPTALEIKQPHSHCEPTSTTTSEEAPAKKSQKSDSISGEEEEENSNNEKTTSVAIKSESSEIEEEEEEGKKI